MLLIEEFEIVEEEVKTYFPDPLMESFAGFTPEMNKRQRLMKDYTLDDDKMSGV